MNIPMQQNISTKRIKKLDVTGAKGEESMGSASGGMIGIEKTRIILLGRELAKRRRQSLVLL